MIVDFNKHPWVHQGNINKVKKLIMDVEEFYKKKIEALERKNKELNAELKLEDQKRESLEWHSKLESDELLETKNNYIQLQKDIIKQLEHQTEKLGAELELENENKRSHVVGLQLQIEELQEDNNNLVEVIKGLDPTNPILQHLKL